MFKKTLLIVSLAASSNLFAAELSVNTFGVGPYAGVGLGLSAYRSQLGGVANFFGGYGALTGQNENLYIGGELNLSIAHYATYKTAYGIGLSLLPGVLLSDYTMFYGRLGIDSVYVPNLRTLTLGPEAGLGIQTSLSEKVDLRGEYTYSAARQNGQYSLGLVYKFD